MSHKMLRPFIVKVSVLGYFPLCTPPLRSYLLGVHICIYNYKEIFNLSY